MSSYTDRKRRRKRQAADTPQPAAPARRREETRSRPVARMVVRSNDQTGSAGLSTARTSRRANTYTLARQRKELAATSPAIFDRDRNRNAKERDRPNGATLRDEPATCKGRPETSTLKGGGSRPFVPWCDRQGKTKR